MKKNKVNLTYQSFIVAFIYLLNTIYETELTIITVAIFWIGYKICLKNKTLKEKLIECAPILIGSIITSIGSIITRFFANLNYKISIAIIMEYFPSIIQTLGVIIFSIAIIWVGYKILFGGQTLRECAPVLTGSIIFFISSHLFVLLLS